MPEVNHNQDISFHTDEETVREKYISQRKQFWDDIADYPKDKAAWGKFYRKRITTIYRHLVGPGLGVLELGCGKGELLASLGPGYGVGLDLSGKMIDWARSNYPELVFHQSDAHGPLPEGNFDVVVLSDLINDLWDVQTVLERARSSISDDGRLIINFHSHLWSPALTFARKSKLAKPNLPQNWLTMDDVVNLLNLSGFEPVRCWREVLWPLPGSVFDFTFNRVLSRFWPFKNFCLANFIVARPKPRNRSDDLPVSIVVPARNEAGNIEGIIQRLPEMGRYVELIFVEGGSTDRTYEAIEKAIPLHPERKISLYRQPGKGKADAVRLGFEKASGEILMILDADLSVPPEDLVRFLNAIRQGDGEFINGVRLVYPMEKQAMRFLNFLGNKFFSSAFSWLLGQPTKDTLCGTKVLNRKNYERIVAGRSYFGDFDPFGDFDLIFGAAKLNLKSVDLPIRYRERTYGDTNISRWRHGWLLLKMLWVGLKRLKFI